MGRPDSNEISSVLRCMTCETGPILAVFSVRKPSDPQRAPSETGWNDPLFANLLFSEADAWNPFRPLDLYCPARETVTSSISTSGAQELVSQGKPGHKPV